MVGQKAKLLRVGERENVGLTQVQSLTGAEEVEVEGPGGASQVGHVGAAGATEEKFPHAMRR